MKSLTVHYSWDLVVVSVLISMIAAYAAFSLAERMRGAPTAAKRRWWLLGGSAAMGIGIWSMHYLGMLAVQLPVDVSYFVPTVIFSLLLAVAAAVVALTVVSAERLGRWQLLIGGVLMGAGIGGMHYTGMGAMRMTAMHHYDLWIVGLSVLVAVGFSWMALWIGFAVRNRSKHGEWMRIAGGSVMGLGIAAMHYTAMAAVSYMPDHMPPYSTAWTMRVGTLGQAAVAVATAVILVVALGTAALDKRRFRELEEAQEALLTSQQALLDQQRELLESKQQLVETNALLSELSIRDGLTGLHNRRHFDAIFDIEWRRAARGSGRVALLMVDIDCFKALNDRYGHQRGDDCLREVARVLEGQPRRAHDVVARFGGEEFAVLLPGADLTTAARIAEAIRAAVLALEMEHAGSTAARFVTVSIGVCSRSPLVGEESEGMVRDADTALYVAKELGRNRVEMAGEMPVRA